MKLTRRQFCAALALTALPITGRAGSTVLTIGLFPNLPARRLIELYQPLADYLAVQLGCQVRLFSARDFRSFYKATHDNQFDVVVTAPHLAWLAMVESDYRPLVTFTSPISGVVIVRRNEPIPVPGNCEGKVVAMIDPLAIVSQLGLEYLKLIGLTANVDYRVAVYSNHANAALAVTMAQADCAVVGKLPFQQMPAEVQSKLRIIGETQSVPSQFVMVGAALPAALRERIRAALIGFNYVAAGADFIKTNHIGAIVAANPDALAAVKPYALVTRAMLSQGGE
jgi:phosphonate transport system substrate-binding protein